MSTDLTVLYRNNSHTIQLTLVDSDDVAVGGATVTVTGYVGVSATAVSGPTWPLTLAQVGVTNVYEGTLDASDITGLNLAQRVRLVVSVDVAGEVAEFVRYVTFGERAA